mmetsp:Transcript_1582/g.2349  ORF Transcript_1582/g.2349 Transcript_1582/m.2349 type:complete len:561 (-) Transcript_1582:161-1843(-)
MTKRGKDVLKTWLRYPTNCIDIIKDRLAHVKMFVDPRYDVLVKDLQKHLRHIKDIDRILSRLYTVRANLTDWSSLYNTLRSINSITKIIGEFPSVPAFQNILSHMTEDVAILANAIGSMIDFEESKISNRISIMTGCDEELDLMKAQLEGLDDFLGDIAAKDLESNAIPSCILQIKYIYFPQLGYHLEVPYDNNTTPSLQSGVLGNLSFRFRADEYVYYKNERTHELDEEFGDIQGIVADLEASMVRNLTEKILILGKPLRKIGKGLYKLDALLSLATTAINNSFAAPSLVSESKIIIKDGRHPLQELCCEDYIPNDTHMDMKNGVVHVITGPNASGKSVYLKTVGIITYLAHVGSFVPANSATIGIVDKIFTRIDTSSSSMSNLSTFTRDASEASHMLNKCTERSLLLIDEFGKGTHSIDGCSLLGSMISNLDKLSSNCPRSIITTHFHEIFVNDIITESDVVKFHQMNVLHERNEAKHGQKEIIFLYKLVPGVCLHSQGIYCATQLGLPKQVVSRASEIMKNCTEGIPIPPLNNVSTLHHLPKERNKAIISGFLEVTV